MEKSIILNKKEQDIIASLINVLINQIENNSTGARYICKSFNTNLDELYTLLNKF